MVERDGVVVEVLENFSFGMIFLGSRWSKGVEMGLVWSIGGFAVIESGWRVWVWKKGVRGSGYLKK